MRTVGVMGDGRTYDYVVALRAVQTARYRPRLVAGDAHRSACHYAETLEGVTVEYGYFPWKRAYDYARSGKWDGSALTPFFTQGLEGTFGFMGAIPIAMVAFGAIVAVSFMVGEIKNPKKTVPQSMIIAMSIVLVLYVLMILTTLGLVTAALAYVTGHRNFAEYLLLVRFPQSAELTVFCGALVGASFSALAAHAATLLPPGTPRTARPRSARTPRSSASPCSSPSRPSSPSTSAVCSPSSGAGRRTVGGPADVR